MGIFDFFNKTTQGEKAEVKGYTMSSVITIYNLSFQTYYKFYELNPFVFAAINRRSNDVGAVGFELTKGGKKVLNNEFEALVKFTTTPTPREFIKRLVRDYEITGNCYVYIRKNEKGTAEGIQVLDPRYMTPIIASNGTPIGFVQNLNGIRAFLPGEVFHLKYDNDMEQEGIGKSKMTSLFLDVESDQEARESNLAFFKNNQTPSSIVVIDPDFSFGDDTSEKDIRAEIKNLFLSGKYQGGKNRHRTLTAQGIKEVIKIQDKISDMEFLELRKFTRDVVLAIYEVPGFMLGFTQDVNLSNGEGSQDIYYSSIENQEEKFAAFLMDIFKVFDPRYKFEFLKDNLRKLKIRAEIAGSLYKDKGLITKNEGREIIQYDPEKDGDTYYEVKSLNITTEEKKEEK